MHQYFTWKEHQVLVSDVRSAYNDQHTKFAKSGQIWFRMEIHKTASDIIKNYFKVKRHNKILLSMQESLLEAELNMYKMNTHEFL